MEIDSSAREGKQIVIDDLEGWRETARLGFAADRTVAEAFPNIVGEGRGSGFAAPYNALLKALEFYWLCAISNSYGAAEAAELRTVVQRGVSVSNEFPDVARFRSQHDYLLITLAIVIGFQECKKVAKAINKHSSQTKPPGSLLPQFYAACILQENDAAQRHAAMYCQSHVDPAFALPSKKLVQCFVSDDANAFSKQWHADVRKHWTLAERAHAILKEKPTTVLVDSIKKGINWLWPWPETVLAKLMFANGHKLQLVSAWIPNMMLIVDAPA